MGHDRVGFLPKSKRWKDIIFQISGYSEGKTEISDIINNTLTNVQSRYNNLNFDNSLISSFKFFVALALASKSENPNQELQEIGISLPKKFTSLDLAKTLHLWLEEKKGSFEYRDLAERAAMDTIVYWYKKNNNDQLSLFKSQEDSFHIWYKTSQGSGFCEIARSFFGYFTQHYLKYFLEREASSHLISMEKKKQFINDIDNYSTELSLHAFETSKITQSFAAGWFNKNIKDKLPSDEQITNFIGLALKKIKEELRRENADQ